jgi:DNA-binding NarL/FixJ family response regulator
MIQDTILIVDDEPAVLSALHRALRSEPWRIISELSAEGALVRMREQDFKVVISDERI